MRLAIPFALLLMVPTSPYAQSRLIERIDVRNAGIYDVEIARTTDDKNLVGGKKNIVSNRRNLQVTATVPARVCVSFGFEYVLLGTPTGAEVPVRMVTRFPAVGVRNPETGVTTYHHETVVLRTIGHVHFRSYTLEKEWEVVPGIWTFELWYGDRKLADRSFTLSQSCGEECDQRHGMACGSAIAFATPLPE